MMIIHCALDFPAFQNTECWLVSIGKGSTGMTVSDRQFLVPSTVAEELAYAILGAMFLYACTRTTLSLQPFQVEKAVGELHRPSDNPFRLAVE